jgi:hypothetical protein
MIDTLAFSPHGDQLAYAVREESTLRESFTLHVRDLRGARERTLREDAKTDELGGCSGLVFSPDGRIIAVGGHAGVALFKLEGEKVVAVLRAKRRMYYGRMSFSADGTTLLAATLPRAALFDLRSGRLTTDLEYGSPQHTALCHSALSADGQRIAMSWLDNSVRLFDARSGRALASIQEGLGSAFSQGSCWVAFSPDGASVLTASRDADGSRLFVRRRSAVDGGLLNKMELVQPRGTCPYIYPTLFATDASCLALVGIKQETRFVPEPGMGWVTVHEGVVAIYDSSGLLDGRRIPVAAVPKSSAGMSATLVSGARRPACMRLGSVPIGRRSRDKSSL